MLLKRRSGNMIEAGVDEAGRGCLAGPVFAAAVILPEEFDDPGITDSKLLNKTKREKFRKIIEGKAVAWAVAQTDNMVIDEINILNATFRTMHETISMLKIKPALLLIDGNRFKPFKGIHHECIVKGDRKYLSVAAASILAKTYRDEYMEGIHQEYPQYHWNKNKGYSTELHRKAIRDFGTTPYHRISFNMGQQLSLVF